MQIAKSISFTSGKGGVGKTNIASNIALSLASIKKKTLLFDADFGLANIDIIFGIKNVYTLEQFLGNEIDFSRLIYKLPSLKEYLHIIPSSSGVAEMTSLGDEEQHAIIYNLANIMSNYDYLIIDTGAGISEEILRMNASADEIMVVTTTEPTARADAYSLMKNMQRFGCNKFNLIVNEASASEADAIYHSFVQTAQKARINIEFIGNIVRDSNLTKAVQRKTPILHYNPQSPFSRSILKITKNILYQKKDNKKHFWGDFFEWMRK